MPRLDRENFLVAETVDNISERDLVTGDFDLFVTKRPCEFYTLNDTDVQRPDLLSLKLYRRMDLWWVLLKYNGIDDAWNDIIIGSVIKIPNILDIEDWISKN